MRDSNFRFNTVFPILSTVLFLLGTVAGADTSFKVPESVPPGHIIGYVEGRPQVGTETRYFVVFTNTDGENVINVNDRTGEITVIGALDYEKQKKYDIVVVPIGGGDGFPITIQVEDENDNAPVFTQDSIRLEISEFAKIGAEFPLPSAIDSDGPPLDVQSYRIAQGNVNNVFKLSSKRINNVLYADLVVNGKLDREYRESYDLLIEAVDGGENPRIGELQVSVLILDANDNSPIFTEKDYHVVVEPNVARDKVLLHLKAVDKDAGHNGMVAYRMAETRSTSSRLFSVSPQGELSRLSDKPLPVGDYEIAVVASDHGVPPQESTVIVSISVEGQVTSSPSLDIVWLTERADARLPENATLGSIVARVNVTNNELAQGTLELLGCPSLCMQQSQTVSVYLVILCGLLDRETSAEYHVKFVLRKDKEVVLEHPLVLSIEDTNDNAPKWSVHSMHITLNRTVEHPDDPNLNLAAVDPDSGANGRIRYSISGTDLIGIDEDTGRLRYLHELDCSIGSELHFTVIARDGGTPPQSSSIEVTADVVDSVGRAPQFEKPLYSENLKEDADVGTCLLKVKAHNNNCGGSRRIRYSLKEQRKDDKTFTIDSQSGTLCLERALDYEREKRYQLTVEAHDHAGNIATALVNIDVIDINDNAPVFYPTEYNITVRESAQRGENAGGAERGETPLLVVAAEDADSGKGGEVSYKIVSGDSKLFHVNSTSGEIFTRGRLSQGVHTLGIVAEDGMGQPSVKKATVQITVISESTPAPRFTQSKYEIFTSEDILPGISIGEVAAFGTTPIRYSIYSGDPEHQFTINPETGKITVARYLDADKHDTVLLNVKADMDGGGSNHTQVIIHVEDHNDNAPEFAVPNLELTVREDTKPQEAIYVVQALDKDKKKNGQLSYTLVSSYPESPIMVQPITGQLVLTGKLDYEMVKEYKLRVKAQDHGVPPRAANVTVIVRVSDVNDNEPIFDKEVYTAEIVEHSSPMTTVSQVHATDADSDANGRVEYRLEDDSVEFGIDSKSGSIFVKGDIDREKRAEYNLTVTAVDGGTPQQSSSSIVRVLVRDVNDHSPQCDTVTSLTVPADADTRNPFGTIIASDPDQAENGTIIYRSQQNNQLFMVKANGDVFLRKPLRDAPQPSDMSFSVVASDGGSPKRSTVCHVSVRMVEGMSSIHLVKPFESTIRIGENCGNGCRLTTVNATNVANWQIQSSDISSHFSVSSSGVLSLVSLPPLHSTYSLTIVLTDAEGRQKHITLKILPYRDVKGDRQLRRLSPTLPIGSRIAEIGERRDKYFYSILNETSLVELDESTGTVYLIDRLKRHVGEVIDLHFKEVSMNDFESTDKWLSLEIETGDAERPKFEQNLYRSNLSESTSPGTIVFSLSAYLSSSNTLLSYRLLEGEEYLSIDPTRGDITLQKDVDWSDTPQLFALVEAEHEGVSTTTAVVFDVIDVNNHSPKILSASSILLVYPYPDPIHYVVAVDEDNAENGRLSYSIVAGDMKTFRINETTGAISVLQRIDADQSITVRAIDNGSPALSQDQKIEIKLHHSSSRWSFFQKSTFSIDMEESTEVGQTMVEFQPKESVTFSLFPRSSPFEIDAFTGVVKVASKLVESEYKLVVYVEDSSNNSDHATVLVSVGRPTAIDLKISSPSCSNTTVTENKAVSNLKQIVVIGSAGHPTFKIQAGNDHSVFKIDENTGIILCSELDREKKEEYILVVTVEEQGHSDTCTVRVAVADENDNAPQFTADAPQTLTLSDASKVGDSLARFTASDPDLGPSGQVFFELFDDPSGLLDIETDTGRVFYAREMPVVHKEWLVRVRASDRGVSGVRYSERKVKIRDHRTHYADPSETPQFLRQQYIGVVEEGKERGQNVAQVSTSARDARLTYSIVEGNLDSAFDIDAQGVIRTAQELDREIQGDYHLHVIATGNFPGQLDTKVDVRVLNTNDNPPSFPPVRRRKLSEATPIGAYITTVTANDIDADTRLEYTIESESADGKDVEERHFAIERFTGAVHLMEKLDYESGKDLRVKIKASDGVHDAFTELSIEVLDENDNAPQFSQNFYDITVSEGTTAGTIVTQLSAIDRDGGDNGLLSYTIDDPNGMFRIDATNGSLTTLSSLPPASTFLLTVRARDSGLPSLHSDATLRIHVSSAHETRQPHFSKTLFSFVITEKTPTYSIIGNVSVGDQDEPLFYRIIDAEINRYFSIDRFGRIRSMAKLDRERTAEYYFEVDVSSGWNPLSANSSARVTIKIGDANDNYPIFENLQPRIQVTEQLKEGQVLQRLSVVDPDEGDSGRVAYRLVSGNDYGIFSLEQDTGALVFNRWVDEQIYDMSENETMFSLTVVAKDYGTPSRFSVLEVPIELDVSKWSGSAPFFVVPAYNRHVTEAAGPGTKVMTSRAVNRFGIDTLSLTYSLRDNDEMFSIDKSTGDITLRGQLDYEKRQNYAMSVHVTDGKGRSAISPIEITVLPVDEYAPVFSKQSYTFQVPLNSEIGAEIGLLSAVDADAGRDGVVRFRVEERADIQKKSIVGVDPESGVIKLRSKVDHAKNRTIESVVVVAESGPLQQSRATVYLEIGVFPSSTVSQTLSQTLVALASGATVVLFLVLLCVLIGCVYRYKTQTKEIDNPRKQVYTVSKGQIAVVTDMNRNSPKFAAMPSQMPVINKASSVSSSASAHSNIRHSGHSRDFVSTRSQPDSGIDPDTVSLSSSMTEYLSSLGVNTTAPQQRHRMRRVDPRESELNDFIYARVDDIVGPGPLNVSRTMDSFLPSTIITMPPMRHDSPPTFQPLTEIFSEIERLQAEHRTPRSHPVRREGAHFDI